MNNSLTDSPYLTLENFIKQKDTLSITMMLYMMPGELRNRLQLIGKIDELYEELF
jgi:hypothetical protein